MDRQEIAARLDDAVDGAPGRLGVALRTSDGWAWSRHADRVTRAASTIKVPVLLTVLRLAERGVLDLRAPVALPPAEARVGGAGPLSLLPSVTTLPLIEALRLMIALSDNDATNAVIDHAGLLGSGEVEGLLADVPTSGTALRRRLMDTAAAARGVENETCPGDLVAVLAALREGRLLGPGPTHTALEVLRTQQWRDGLPAFLPPDVVVGSKTGDLVGLRADMALVERGERWVAVAVIADELTDGAVDRGTAVLPAFATIGELAADALGGLV